MKKRYVALLSLIALLSAGCTPKTSSSSLPSSSESSTTTTASTTAASSSSPSSSTSWEEKVLAQLQKDPLAFKGTLTEWLRQEGYPDQAIETPLEVYASGERYYNVAKNASGAAVDVIDFFADEEGYLAEMFLDPYTNTMVEKAISNKVLFAEEFGNPFLELSKEDLRIDGTQVTFDVDADFCLDLADFTTYYDYLPMDRLTTTIDADGTIESLTLSYEVSASDDPNYGTYQRGATFVFELVDPSSIDLPVYQPRPENAETERLQELFDSMAEGNYTVHTTVTITDEYGPYDDQDYTVFYTEQGDPG